MRKYVLLLHIFLTALLAAPTGVFPMTGEEAVAKFQSRMRSINTMRGTISWTDGSGFTQTGNFRYMAPNRVYMKFTSPSGKIIASNGRKLYMYNSSSNICGVQDLGRGGSGGIAALVSGYNAVAFGGAGGYTIKLSNSQKHYSNITLVVDSSFMLKKALLQTKDGGGTTINLSGVITGEGMSPGIFDFNPPAGSQTINNPLNIK